MSFYSLVCVYISLHWAVDKNWLRRSSDLLKTKTVPEPELTEMRNCDNEFTSSFANYYVLCVFSISGIERMDEKNGRKGWTKSDI